MTLALDNFIPEVWAAQLLTNLDKNFVWAQGSVVNRDYEGEITGGGDTVNINQLGPVTVSAYTPGTDMSAPQTLSSTQKKLVIDQYKAFNFVIDDVDNAQSVPKIQGAGVQRAAVALADDADKYVAGIAYAGVDTGNVLVQTGTGAIGTDAYENIVDLGTALDNANVPSVGRWLIAKPAFVNSLAKNGHLTTSTQDGVDVVRNGFVGNVGGFAIMKSVNSPTGALAVCGSPLAISFADQIPANTVEQLRMQNQFGTQVRGLHVYGAKVVLPTALAVLKAS